MAEKLEHRLLNNHLAFLASHRGLFRRNGDTVFVESDRPEFTYAILGNASRREGLSASAHTVQLLPWSQVATSDLTRAGFSPSTGISYMILDETLPEWRTRSDLVVERVDGQVRMAVFSQVQSRGFNETQSSFDLWHPWLKAANDRNLDNPDQCFYVGSLEGEPVGTVLTVSTGTVAGIYAVATLPHQRKKGISTTIMSQAIADARRRGASTITLQVKQDSYVEDFYRHLGFKRIFATGMYRRNS
jgi:GNAT superfamily N-acetyltransferase